MAKKKNKKRNPKPAQSPVRLSQVMIVKNEEKNIERALSWAKGIAFEQIVVDTGSTDSTVEIAEKMGAKVFRFEWIDDFGAAKNYAIEQASGNWIAFLDADEFFHPADAKHLLVTLKKIQADPELRVNCLVINCPLANVDDNGKVFSIYEQERVFRNMKSVRFIGKIHERLNVDVKNIFYTTEMTVIHTGYSQSAFGETQKSQRNIDILRQELEDRPNDGNIQMYLADALRSSGGEENDIEAVSLYERAVAKDSDIMPGIKMEGFLNLIRLYMRRETDLPIIEAMCRTALEESPGNIDFGYYLGLNLNNQGRHHEAMTVLKSCEATLLALDIMESSRVVAAEPKILFSQLVLAAYHLKDAQSTIRYGMMVLAEDKTLLSILSHCIATFVEGGVSDEEIIRVLSQIYNFDNNADIVMVARAAKGAGVISFAKKLLDMTGLTDSETETAVESEPEAEPNTTPETAPETAPEAEPNTTPE